MQLVGAMSWLSQPAIWFQLVKIWATFNTGEGCPL